MHIATLYFFYLKDPKVHREKLDHLVKLDLLVNLVPKVTVVRLERGVKRVQQELVARQVCSIYTFNTTSGTKQ